jgi:predicted RND superfamily exporter protein
VFLAPLVVVSLFRVRMNNDVVSWLPSGDREARILAWAKSHFPSNDRILVTWDGSTLDDPRSARMVQALTGVLGADGVRRGGHPAVKEVITAQDVCTRMIRFGVEPEEALKRLEGSLIGTGLVKVRLTPAGRTKQDSTLAALRQVARERLGVEIEVLPPHEPFVDDAMIAAWEEEALEEDEAGNGAAEEAGNEGGDAVDEEGLAAAEVALPEVEIPTHDVQVRWAGLRPQAPEVHEFCQLARDLRGFATAEEPDGLRLVEDCFLATGTPVGLIVTLSEAGQADHREAIQAIRAAAWGAGIEEDQLALGGGPVTNAALNEAVKAAAWNTHTSSWWPHERSVILLSGSVGITLAFVFLQSIRLGLLVLVVSYYTSAITLALVPLTGDTLNVVLMVMPTLVNVITLSGAIHVANYWKHAAHEDFRTAVVRATEIARQPCVFASLTTVIGLLSLLTSELAPVRSFGLFSAIGTLISLGMVLYVLPSLLQLWPMAPPALGSGDNASWRRLGGMLVEHGRLVSLLSLLLLGFSVWGLRYFRTETKVIRNFPADARVVRDSRVIEESLSGIASVDAIVRFSPRAQRDLPFLQRMEVVRAVEQSLREHPEISGAVSLADFQPVREPPPASAKSFTKMNYHRRSNETEQRIKDGEAAGAEAFLAMADEAADLHQPGDGELNTAGDELWRISAQAAILSDADYSRLMDELNHRVQLITRMYPGTRHVVTGTIPLFLRAQQAVLDSLVDSFRMAFVVIAVVMVIVLRSVVAGLISMLPNIAPVGIVFGLMSWSGVRIDVGSMVTASVALGIAVDGTLHLLTWFREGIRAGMSRREAIEASLAHCGPATWQTSAAVALGLLMLYPADLVLISRFGWLMAVLIGAALLGDLVLLPALLSGMLGGMLERIEAQKKSGTNEVLTPAPPVADVPAPHFAGSRRRAGRRRGLPSSAARQNPSEISGRQHSGGSL